MKAKGRFGEVVEVDAFCDDCEEYSLTVTVGDARRWAAKHIRATGHHVTVLIQRAYKYGPG